MVENVQILVVDNAPTFRQRVAEAMRDSCLPLVVVVRQAASEKELYDVCADDGVAVDLLVIEWESASADTAFGAIKKRLPQVPIVVSSQSNSLAVPQQAFAAGAAGFIRRDSPPALIRSVIDVILCAEGFAVPDHFRPT
ncbi:response regulator [Caballeronia calidae]|nr:response regulator [Caballeronia calidae]